MLKVIRNLLIKIINEIDAGNSNLSEKEMLEVLNNLSVLSNKEKRLSKYSACKYLNVSRATFDNYIKNGKLIKGKHEVGFKELSWSEKDLDKFINKSKKSNH